MKGLATGWLSVVALMLLLQPGCFEGSEGTPGGGQVDGAMVSSVAQIGCSPEGSEVLLLVETSERMAEPSGFKQGSQPLSRYEVVKDTLKRSLPHLKKEIDFGLLTFPYDGNTDKNGRPRVCPGSCGVGPVQVQPGEPYGWIVSTLEHVALGGNASVAGALASARSWFKANPAGGKDRLVVLFVAGEDQCNGDVLAEIGALKAMGIPTIVVAPENAPDFAQDVMAQWAEMGGRPNPGHPKKFFPLRPGSAVFDDSMSQVGAPEVCDGLDNDCDGETDEDVVEVCETECGKGHRVCQLVAKEVVTGFKVVKKGGGGHTHFDDATGDFLPGFDDINTIMVPIIETVYEPGWSECVIEEPNPELCDGLDNDCDGETDEDFDVGAPCTAGSGTCSAVGRFVCRADGLGVECSAKPKGATPEVCDGVDNDCDGAIDEGLTEACETACGSGFRVCKMGTWGECQVTKPAPEVCNGKDDDCDGLVDEGFDVGALCVVGEGKCSATGVKVCSEDGLETVCKVSGNGSGTPEVCDGIDNDCDGLVDEGPGLCPSGQVCFKGQCVYD